MTPAELSARKVDLEEAAGYLGDLRGIIVSMCLTPAASPELKLQAARAVHDLALALGLVSLAPAPKKAPRLSAKRQAPEESFETWWKVYPYKTAKGDARKAWGQTSMDRPPLEAVDEGERGIHSLPGHVPTRSPVGGRAPEGPEPVAT